MFLGKLKLKDRPFFKELTQFDFGVTGLTVVHGLNLNGGNSENTNGAGKSLLFSNVQDLLYREVLVGSRRDRVTEGLAYLELGKSKDDMYALQSKQVGKTSAKMSILKDGESLGIREQVKVDEFVKEIVPPTLVAYSTLCHIDNRIPHPLIRGDTAARRDFFTKFFELDSTDSLRKLVSANLTDIKAESRLLSDRRARFEALPPRVSIKALRAELEDLDMQKSVRHSEIESYNDKAALRSFCIAHREELDSVPDLKALKAKVNALEEKIAASFASQEYQAEFKHYKTLKAARKAYIKENSIKRTELEELGAAIDEAEEAARNGADHAAKLAKLKEEYSSLIDPILDEANCNECGAELTGALRKKHLSKHAARVVALEEKRVALADKIKKVKTIIKELPEAVDIAALNARLKIVRGMPQPIDEPDTPEGYVEEGEDTQTLSAKLKVVRDKLAEYSWANSPLYALAKAADIDKLLAMKDPTKEYLEVIEKMSALDIEYQLAKKNALERRELAEEIERTENVLLNAEALEILERAYSPKGLRRILINTVCASLETSLNNYAKTLFPEDYRFELTLESQFDILVHRKSKGETMVSDVRRLSGAESSLFSLLLWCGLMSFTPKAKRPNFLILDELDANLGDDNRDRFLAFLPKILKVVDHVIVITPKSETRFEAVVPEVRYLTVVKQGLSSTIHEGKSSSIKESS